jgi:hypothetical protein
LCQTDIGSKSGYDLRVVQIDLDKPERENWVEMMGENDLSKDSDIKSVHVGNNMLMVTYLTEGYDVVKLYNMTTMPFRYIRDLNFPMKG